MSVKFNIGFTMDAETLFGIIAKFIPIENLTVEEVVERPQHHAPPRIASPAKQKPKRRGSAIDIKEGVNGAILRVLEDGKEHRYAELKQAVSAAGYAGSGIGSRVGRLVEHKAVIRVGPGAYVKGKE